MHGRLQRGAVPLLWIFIHSTVKVEGGLMVLFLVLFFPLPPLPGKFSADTLGSMF